MKEEKEGLLPGGIRAPYPFDAAETLDCGQAFRWVALPGEAGASLWEGVAFGKVLRVEQRGQQVWLGCSPEGARDIPGGPTSIWARTTPPSGRPWLP